MSWGSIIGGLFNLKCYSQPSSDMKISHKRSLHFTFADRTSHHLSSCHSCYVPGRNIVLAVTTMITSVTAVRNTHTRYTLFFIPWLISECSAELGLLTLFVEAVRLSRCLRVGDGNAWGNYLIIINKLA
jgi:hypothetical protein